MLQNVNNTNSNNLFPQQFSSTGFGLGSNQINGTDNLMNDLMSNGLQLPKGKRGHRTVRIIDTVVSRMNESFQKVFSQMTEMMQSMLQMMGSALQSNQGQIPAQGDAIGGQTPIGSSDQIDSPHECSHSKVEESESNSKSPWGDIFKTVIDGFGGANWGMVSKGASWAGDLLGKAGGFLKNLFL